jgi:type II secretory pathway component PulK
MVLVIVVLLGMLAIGFSFSTRAGYSAMGAQASVDQARNCAMSGIEGAALLLRQKFDEQQVWYSNPQLFKDQPVDVETNRLQKKTTWQFSLVGPNLEAQDKVRYGLTDEAQKVNINVASEDQLKRLPGMTAEMAAALMDWREKGDTPRPGGAKDEYYMSLEQPYRCKKAPLDTVEELLLVKGFDGSKVFGEDMNRNGILDPNENDGRKSLPIDNSDGILDRGLYPYITVYSREPEVTETDPYQPRVNIKDWPEALITSLIGTKLKPEIVKFIIEAKNAKVDFGSSPASLLGMKISKGGTQTETQSTTQPATQPAQQESGGSVSPVTVEDLETVMDLLTTGYHLNSDGCVYGRINVNTASRAVLRTIGRLTESEIDGIIATRSRLDAQSTRTLAWLVKQNVLTAEKFKEVACLFTARSYQFMIEALGYYDHGGAQARIQAVLELRLPRVQYIYWRDLTSLGKAYDLSDFGETNSAVKQ